MVNPKGNNMRKIAVFTGTRAEYGLLYPLINGLNQSSLVELQLFVGGAHLSHQLGYTIKNILEDGFTITEKWDFLLASDTPVATNKSMALAQISAAESFEKHKPDMLVLLGDRYESLAVALAATIVGIPIAHIHGGEITQAAIDDAFRHSLSKLAHWHFTSTEIYRQRIIQLGEQPDNIFNVGAPGLDNIRTLPLMSSKELGNTLGLDLSTPYFLMTYHPETLSELCSEKALHTLLSALDTFPDINLIITYPNADTFGRQLIHILKTYAKAHPTRVFLCESMGQLKFLSAMKHAQAVVGNSSSGIIEAPSFNIPTINIGDRQNGRIACESVLHCNIDKTDIVETITQALSLNFQQKINTLSNPYGDGKASERILKRLISEQLPSRRKVFYDLPSPKYMDRGYENE